MRIQVRKTELLSALRNCKFIISNGSKSDGPIIQNIHMKTDDINQRVIISATNYNESFRQSIPCFISEIGETATECKKLYDVVNKSKGDEIEIDARPSTWVHLSSGNLKMKLPETSPDLLPIINDSILPGLFILRDKKLSDIVEKTISFIGDDPVRLSLTGLSIRTIEDRLQFEGADAYRIGHYHITDPILLGDDKIDMIIPKRSISNISKIFKDEGELTFSGNSISCQVRAENLFYNARLIEAEYPVLDRLFEKRQAGTVVETSDIIDAVDMMQVMNGKDKSAVMKITFNSELEFSDMESGSVSIEHGYSGPESVMGINTFFFSESLKVFKKSENIDIGFASNCDPIIMTGLDIDYFKACVMPVRIEW